MPHEVFISYSRTDLSISSEVFELIQRIGYVPYRDVDDLAGGHSWSDQLREALAQPDIEPYVVILCTKAAVAEPQGVVEELLLAREHDLTVIPVEFDPGAAKYLLRAAGYDKPGQIHYIDAVNSSGRYIVTDRLENDLRRALIRRVRKRLEGCRVLAKEWAERLNRPISFWATTWRDYFQLDSLNRLSESVVLTARGGSGKSFLIAHCIRQLLDNPDVYPVLVDEDLLRHATRNLPIILGARSEADLPRQVEALAAQSPGVHLSWKPIHVMFVVDGLDQMVTPGDAQQKQLVDGLNLLVDSAPVLIGCRQEIWDAWYNGRVSVHEARVPEVDALRVRDLLRKHTTLDPDCFNPLLQVPFFLDITLAKSRVWDGLPPTQTAFLQQIWSDAVNEASPGLQILPDSTGRSWLLQNLAACQLAQLAYDVPLVNLTKRPGYLPEFQTGLNELKEARLLVEQPPRTHGAGRTVRLRHDLLDNYSMMQVLLSTPDKLERLRDLCSRCGKDCGWSLLSTLVQATHDWGNTELKRQLFAEFLFILDRKHFDDENMTRAWAVTHVLKSCFGPLFRLILEGLASESTPSLAKGDPAQAELRPSTLGPLAQLTQEAASTLASAFMVLHAGSVKDAAIAVPVLARGLETWKLKARFIDALAKYRTDYALMTIVAFGRKQLRQRDDLGSMLYVARNLRHFPRVEAHHLLRDIIADMALKSMVRRVAAESLDHLLPGQVIVPLRDEDEIVEGLKVRDDHGRYSDWHVVQESADHVRGRVARGDHFGPRVLEALTRALDHDQTFVRRSVAKTLALFDEPSARDALLNEVLEQHLPAEVRSACLEALELQLRRLVDPRVRQAYRYLLLRAARVARHAGDVMTDQELSELALKTQLRTPEDWLLTTRAAEVAPPANGIWSVRYLVTAQEPDQAILHDLAEAGLEDVGPNLEPKYRFADLKHGSGVLEVSLAATNWHQGKNFHAAVHRHPGRFLRYGGCWLAPVPLGDASLPGLAVVHVLVVTADGHLLLAQRSSKQNYAPLHWSTSFEEQVTEQDVCGGDRVFYRAARRGMVEEFGIDVEPPRVHLLSVVLELDNLNLAVVMLIEAIQTLEQIRQSWLGIPRPSHAWEAQALDSINAELDTLESLARGAEFRLEPLHPTAGVRCALLARWLRWRARE